MKELSEVIVKTPETPEEIQGAQDAYNAAWGFLYGDDVESHDIKKTIASYPEGFFTVFCDGAAAGNFMTFRMAYELNDPVVSGKTWRELTVNGTSSDHQPEGTTLYGSDLGVDPKFRGKGLAIQLLDAAKQHCIKHNIKQLVLGCRIPDYHQYADMPVEEYIKLRREDNQFLDRELRFYTRCGLTFTKALPEYMSGLDADPDSLNFGVQSVWANPQYNITF